jgi:hypothetical protein
VPPVGQHAQADPELFSELNEDPIVDQGPPAQPQVPGDVDQGLANNLAADLGGGGGGGGWGGPAAQPLANLGQGQSKW